MKLRDLLPLTDDSKSTKIRKAMKMRKRLRHDSIPTKHGIKGVGSNEPTIGHSVLDGPYK